MIVQRRLPAPGPLARADGGAVGDGVPYTVSNYTT